MLYRMLCAAIALIMLASTIPGCGGGSGTISLSEPTSAVSSSAGLQIQYAQPVEGNGLRQQVDYNYDCSGFAAVEGFAVVPMATEQTPDFGKPDAFRMEVTHDGADRRIKIDCAGAGSPLLHLRYDPAVWQVDGVGVLNPFTTEGYVTFVDILEPGLLAISAAPATTVS